MWIVYSACHVPVATYSTERGAAGHVASWPALYYSSDALPVPTDSPGGHDSPPVKHTRTKSDG